MIGLGARYWGLLITAPHSKLRVKKISTRARSRTCHGLRGPDQRRVSPPRALGLCEQCALLQQRLHLLLRCGQSPSDAGEAAGAGVGYARASSGGYAGAAAADA